jgi:hypothetical protein
MQILVWWSVDNNSLYVVDCALRTHSAHSKFPLEDLTTSPDTFVGSCSCYFLSG